MPEPRTDLRLAVIGDVHLAFGPADVQHLDAGGYDAVLFVGDLSGYARKGALRVARYVRSLRTRTLVIAGNHDTVGAPQLIAELSENERACEIFGSGQSARVAELKSELAPAELVGYSLHRVGPVCLVAARPHSFGGPRLAFRPYLTERFGVATMDDSAARLRTLVDRADAPIVFLAHNGPAGLGDRRDAIWGCDFRRSEGDFGDPDLEAAITHARASGRRVLAVLAGHMHHALKRGGQRRWMQEKDGTLYVNAARVPRVYRESGRERRHMVEVTVSSDGASAREILF